MPFDRQQVNDLFDAAVELTGTERAEFLERECADNHELRAEVESLLAADADVSRFIDDPILSIPPEIFPEASTELAGQQFGAYRIVREIGRGGLGTVYLAERADEAYRKEVAIKLIRRGLDTDDILHRFRNERQILAQLEHPHIARLLDGGTTSDGLPFFVMEYVAGEPLLDYCESRRLSIDDRLELFRKICATVTYAHQNLVIHRDLKPSNILVTVEGEPKLLDFGIARVLTAENEDLTLTAPAARLLTPNYASPEQISGGRLTTSSDIYSLGVILYELLTGQKPYRIKSGTSEEMARAVTEQEPERPSTAAARQSGNQRSETRNQRSLRGDLDNIVLMALRKEPERRYISAAAFADDIERYLTGRPVIAHHDTVTYRASKFVRRHKAGVLSTVFLLLAIIAGITGTLWQSRQANLQRAKAEKRFDDVRKLANSNLFDVYPEVENLAGSLKAREKILQNALHYLDSLAKEAGGDLDLQSELATGYEKVGDVQGALNNSNLGNTKAGLETYRKANALRASVVAARPNDLEAREKLARNGYTIARTLWMDSQTKEAEEEFEKTLGLQRALVAAKPDSPELKDKLAVTLIDYAAIPAFNSQSEKTLTLLNEALPIVDQLREKDPANPTFKKTKARLLRQVGKSKDTLGDYAGGLEAFQTALTLSKEAAQQAPDDFRAQRAVWLTECMTCEHFIDQGNGAEAVRGCEGTIEFPRRALEKEPENGVVAYDLAISYFNLARACRLSGNFKETVSNADAAIAEMSKLSAKSSADADYKRNLAIYKTEKARAQIALRQSDDALAALREAEEIMRPIVAADPKSSTSLGDLGMAYRLQAQAHQQKGNHREAAGMVDKAIEIVQRLKEQKSLRDSEKDLLAELEAEKAEYSR
ncbi:MAG: protein kinase [Spartobacteria bacterium]